MFFALGEDVLQNPQYQGCLADGIRQQMLRKLIARQLTELTTSALVTEPDLSASVRMLRPLGPSTLNIND